MGERRPVHGRRKDGTEFPAEIVITGDPSLAQPALLEKLSLFVPAWAEGAKSMGRDRSRT